MIRLIELSLVVSGMDRWFVAFKPSWNPSVFRLACYTSLHARGVGNTQPFDLTGPPCRVTIPPPSSPAGSISGLAIRRLRWSGILPSPSITYLTCSPTHRVQASMWGTPKATPPPIFWLATSACVATACCTPWGGMPLDCLPSSTLSKRVLIRVRRRKKTSRISAVRSRCWASVTTGTVRSIPRIQPTTAGPSSFSCFSTTPGTTQ